VAGLIIWPFCIVTEDGRRFVIGEETHPEITYCPSYVHGWRGKEKEMAFVLRNTGRRSGVGVNLTVHPPRGERDLRWPWNRGVVMTDYREDYL